MKNFFTWLLICIFVLSFSFMLIGCKEEPAPETTTETTATEETAAETTAEETTTTEALTGPLKLFTDKPSWQTGWDAIFAGFKGKTGIDVEMTGYTEIDTYTAAVKTGIPTAEGPDVFTWWSNYKIADLAKEGLLEDLTSLYEPVKDKYNPGILDSFSYEGKVYGAPVLVASWLMFYNIPVFEKYGIKEPKTWDEFITICDTLKSKGVTPIGFTIGGGWTSFFWFQQIFASNYPDVYYAICRGEKSWNCDEVKKTFEIWKDMIEKGYFTDPGVDLGNDIPPMFAKGEVGMTYCGDWYTAFFDSVELKGGQDYSVFVMPSYLKDRPKTVIYEAGPMCISNNAKNKATAKAFIEYWLSDEGQTIWSESMNFVSANSSVPKDKLDSVKQKISADVFGDPNAELVVRFWEATLETITLPACASFDKFVLNPDSYEAVISELDQLSTKAWDEYKGK
ncbi:MAG: extracellular solute-binding protein [Actinomycetota bacterium]|nr:extracellular solute-binding protein [Actinomycetota bacterium]